MKIVLMRLAALGIAALVLATPLAAARAHNDDDEVAAGARTGSAVENGLTRGNAVCSAALAAPCVSIRPLSGSLPA
ncbi:hypothetical protein EB229_15270 [Mesorhizobium jarvisii]|uniref:Uncharacterized protein n=1 Tax=Mesorhizobium jarvisii TaxID=1777867 RepID=A0A6M7TJA5_9HYPH|nr:MULTISPECIES: hypothetical protein [Mesorhizobium]OBQ58957.1 hypothetical protein A9K72_27725 [Mesorhizobium loti]QKC63507.1 hypothetical protein EB229_15270 [Mesorhizobium jarvisii]RJT29780.1 hypothetical protein D3242_28145 [Mesorhizobium jarvisii]